MPAYCEPWPGVEERDLARRAAAAVDAAHAQRRPDRRVAGLQRAQRHLGLGDEVGPVRVVDGDPLGRAQRGGARRGGIEVAALARLGQRRPQLVGERGLVGRAQHERAARRRLRAGARRLARAGTGRRGAAGTAIEVRCPLVVRCPGTCSSITTWKLVPPKPNALTPATRVAPSATSQSRASVLTANGDADQSRLGFGRSKFRLGGSTLSRSAKAVLSRPAAPAAALRWPMLDLTEPSATEPRRQARGRERLGEAVRARRRRRRGSTSRGPRSSCTRRARARCCARRARRRAAGRPGWAR